MQQNIEKLFSSAESVNECKKDRDGIKEIVEVPVGVASKYAHIPRCKYLPSFVRAGEFFYDDSCFTLTLGMFRTTYV